MLKSKADEPDERNMGRRFEILCILDGTHGAPGVYGGWSANALAATLSISHFTVHHILQRMRRYALAESASSGEMNSYMRSTGKGVAVKGALPSRTLFWWATEKGKERVKYVGGHETWCPLCKAVKK